MQKLMRRNGIPFAGFVSNRNLAANLTIAIGVVKHILNTQVFLSARGRARVRTV